MPRRLAWILPAFLLLAATTPSRAANIFEGVGTIKSAQILEVNPSVRWRAMGDAGTAAFWDPTHAWANAALLGMATGLQYESGSMDHDVFDFATGRTTLGWGGIGLSTTGRPISGLGKIEREFAGEFGGFTERVESWSLGISTSQVATAIARRRSSEPPSFTRWCDLAIGYSEKRVEEDFVFTDFGGSTRDESRATARDLGILLRTGAPVGPGRIDVAFGYADINTNEPKLALTPTARDTRNGIAARASWDPAAARSRMPGWLRAGAKPLVSAGWAMDFVHTTQLDDSFNGWGAELGLANVLFGRIGREEQAHSWGIGAAVPLGPFAAVRWDHSYRMRLEVPDERRDAWTVWLDPLAIYGAAR